MDHPGKDTPTTISPHSSSQAATETAHLVKDIPAVLRKVSRGTPQEQNDALKAYFLPAASISTPFLRVPPVSDFSVAYIGVVNSRRLIHVLSRLNKLLVRTLEFNIKSASKALFAQNFLDPIHLSFLASLINCVYSRRIKGRRKPLTRASLRPTHCHLNPPNNPDHLPPVRPLPQAHHLLHPHPPPGPALH